MKPLFADISALIAIGNKDDAFHYKAVNLQKEFLKTKQLIITTNAVILELFNTFSQSRYKPIAIYLFRLISQSEQWVCIPADGLMAEGIGRFEKRSDKNRSLVDCISMLAAEKHGITDIFTTDHHFEQAGFNILLK